MQAARTRSDRRKLPGMHYGLQLKDMNWDVLFQGSHSFAFHGNGSNWFCQTKAIDLLFT
jgi:hypothetical protein